MSIRIQAYFTFDTPRVHLLYGWYLHLKTILVITKLVRLSSRFSFMIVRKTASLLSDKEERNMIKWR